MTYEEHEELKKQRNELLDALVECLDALHRCDVQKSRDLRALRSTIRQAVAKATSDNHIVDYSHLDPEGGAK